MNPSEFARQRTERPVRAGHGPMTAPQKALLARLCQRASVPYDASLDSTTASERIAALMNTPPAQRQPAAKPCLDDAAEEAIAATERATEERWRRADRLRSPAEIVASERARSPAEIQADEDRQSSKRPQHEAEQAQRLERALRPWWWR